ncbi:MAG: 3-deoxy-manno-octulosonate cytidylyltransferase [Gammaproteobacteria bacterium]|nr:3-deoxy-manno-octulosonate cytidylyltransferase [Gammaproteobacteria bacterium]
MFRVVIPARYAATRLPGKPLAPLAGQPMFRHVHALACASGAGEVIIATDDERIATVARDFGAAVELTGPDHACGTDRIAEVAGRRGWPEDAIVVNVQADEPLLPPALVAQVARLLEADPAAAMATLATPLRSLAEYLDPNVVKVAVRADGQALYFSRAPIPWRRDTAPAGLASQTDCSAARRHLGLYAYRVGALRAIAAAPSSPLEQLERLEQLRALELGFAIRVADAEAVPGRGVDTPEDLAAVAAVLAGGAGG